LGLFRAGLSDSSTLALGIFQSGTDANDFQGGDGSTIGLTGRWTSAPIYEQDGERLLHLGLAISERLTADSETWLGFLAKERSLLWALLRRRIRIQGPPRLLVAFGKCFPS
jgi:hypothetical protein